MLLVDRNLCLVKKEKKKKFKQKVLLLCAEEGPKALCLSLILYNIMSVSDIMRFVLLLPIFPEPF